MSITIDPVLHKLGIELHLGALEYPVHVSSDSDDSLRETIKHGQNDRRIEMMGHAASADPVIEATRSAFKAAGRDPSRYRPSSEALLRRVLNGKALPEVNNVVDVGNLVSLMTGLPVGIYDKAKIKGDMKLYIAGKDDSFEGLRRENMALDSFIVLGDELGPFGSPYGDSLRTAITTDATEVIFIIYGLNIDAAHVENAAEIADTLMHHFCIPDDSDLNDVTDL